MDTEDRGYRSGQLKKSLFKIVADAQTRFVPDAVDNLRRTLDWVGLDYDEGKAQNDGESSN